MDGMRHPTDRIVKVERSFEWSRLENDLMSSAYEHVLPVGRSARAKPVLTSRKPGCNEFGRSDGGRRRHAAGA